LLHIYEKHYPSSDGIYVCVVWNLVECRNSRDYNTPVITEIKGNLNIRIHRDITGEMWFGVDCYKKTPTSSEYEECRCLYNELILLKEKCRKWCEN
jgi:hypothetical protein